MGPPHGSGCGVLQRSTLIRVPGRSVSVTESLFKRQMFSTVVESRVAILKSVSPLWTRYVDIEPPDSDRPREGPPPDEDLATTDDVRDEALAAVFAAALPPED